MCGGGGRIILLIKLWLIIIWRVSLVTVHLNTQIVFHGLKPELMKILMVIRLLDDGYDIIDGIVGIWTEMVTGCAGLQRCGQKIQVGLIIRVVHQCAILNGVLNN